MELLDWDPSRRVLELGYWCRAWAAVTHILNNNGELVTSDLWVGYWWFSMLFLIIHIFYFFLISKYHPRKKEGARVTETSFSLSHVLQNHSRGWVQLFLHLSSQHSWSSSSAQSSASSRESECSSGQSQSLMGPLLSQWLYHPFRWKEWGPITEGQDRIVAILLQVVKTCM